MVIRRDRGLTVVEIAVFSSILLGLMVILTTFLVQGKRYAWKTESYGSAQREATKIVRHIANDMYRTTNEYVQLGGDKFLFLSSGPLAGEPPVEFDLVTGETLWKSWVHYSHDHSQKTVVRSSIELDSPTSDLATPPPPEVGLNDFVGLPPENVRPVGKGVESFLIVPSGTAVYTVTVTTRFNGSSAETDPDGDFTEVTLSSTVRLPIHQT